MAAAALQAGPVRVANPSLAAPRPCAAPHSRRPSRRRAPVAANAAATERQGWLGRLFGGGGGGGAGSSSVVQAARQRLVEQLGSGRPDKRIISEACDELIAAEVSWSTTTACLFGAPWARPPLPCMPRRMPGPDLAWSRALPSSGHRDASNRWLMRVPLCPSFWAAPWVARRCRFGRRSWEAGNGSSPTHAGRCSGRACSCRAGGAWRARTATRQGLKLLPQQPCATRSSPGILAAARVPCNCKCSRRPWHPPLALISLMSPCRYRRHPRISTPTPGGSSTEGSLRDRGWPSPRRDGTSLCQSLMRLAAGAAGAAAARGAPSWCGRALRAARSRPGARSCHCPSGVAPEAEACAVLWADPAVCSLV